MNRDQHLLGLNKTPSGVKKEQKNESYMAVDTLSKKSEMNLLKFVITKEEIMEGSLLELMGGKPKV